VNSITSVTETIPGRIECVTTRKVWIDGGTPNCQISKWIITGISNGRHGRLTHSQCSGYAICRGDKIDAGTRTTDVVKWLRFKSPMHSCPIGTHPICGSHVQTPLLSRIEAGNVPTNRRGFRRSRIADSIDSERGLCAGRAVDTLAQTSRAMVGGNFADRRRCTKKISPYRW